MGSSWHLLCAENFYYPLAKRTLAGSHHRKKAVPTHLSNGEKGEVYVNVTKGREKISGLGGNFTSGGDEREGEAKMDRIR